MLGALLCNGSHAMDPPKKSHSLETRLDKESMLGVHCQQFICKRTTYEMRQKGEDGVGGRVAGRAAGRADGQVDGWTGGGGLRTDKRTGGRAIKFKGADGRTNGCMRAHWANKRTRANSGWTSGWVREWEDWRMGLRTCGLADERTGADGGGRIPKG